MHAVHRYTLGLCGLACGERHVKVGVIVDVKGLLSLLLMLQWFDSRFTQHS